jgi:hypothetical protein
MQGSLLVKRLSRFWLYRWRYGTAGVEIADYGLRLRPINRSCGVIAGNICDRLGRIAIKWLGQIGHDGRILIEETQVKGMADFLEFPTTHPLLPKTPGVILQTISFLKKGAFCKPT